MLLGRRREQQARPSWPRRRTRRRCRRGSVSSPPSCSDHDAGDRRAARVGLEPDGPRVREQRHVRVLERRPHAEHLGVGLGVHDAREAVAGRAAHAAAERHGSLVEHDAARRVERLEAGGREIVRELLDPRLVRHAPGTGTARSPAARSGPRRARRARGTSARPRCSTAPSRRSRSATRARRRRGGPARRSPRPAGGRARRRRASSRRRRSSAPAAGTACRRRRTTCPATRSGCRRRRRCANQFCGSRGSQSPRSSSRIRLPVGASRCASVPPPAPLPITITS